MNIVLTTDQFVLQLSGDAPADQGSHSLEQVPSDPLKCAQFRAVGRLRDECIGSGECNRSTIAMKTFDRLLVKVPEHT